MKLAPLVIIGAILSGIVLGVGATMVVVLEDTTGTLGLRGREFWWLALILGAFAGLIGGGLEAVLISYFRIRVLWTVLFAAGLSLIVLCFYLWGTQGGLDANHQRFISVVAIWQAVYPILVSALVGNSSSTNYN